MAAKLYGFFDGGRIEEFLDTHQMTEEESVTPRLESHMAKNIARFHAVDNVPFPRPGYKFADTLAKGLPVLKKSFAMLLKMDSYKEVHHIYSYDWETEINWISPLLDPSRHRIVLMHGDAHLQNIGVKNNYPKDEEGELSTILYDYEMSSYNLRGKDLGLLLMSRVGILNPEFIEKNGIDFPSEDKCRNFIEEYMKECRELFDDWDETGKDSFDHIMMETIIGGMVACEEAFVVVMTPAFPCIESKILGGFYFACKERLQTSYPNFAKDL
jgi:aminoglycoside phosphotransferase (APT) family kinase protein